MFQIARSFHSFSITKINLEHCCCDLRLFVAEAIVDVVEIVAGVDKVRQGVGGVRRAQHPVHLFCCVLAYVEPCKKSLLLSGRVAV